MPENTRESAKEDLIPSHPNSLDNYQTNLPTSVLSRSSGLTTSLHNAGLIAWHCD